MHTVLIAGGTGFIGTAVSDYFKDKGHEVRLLSRKPTNISQQVYNWNPYTMKMDERSLEGVSVLINLCGAGIMDKRWTTSRLQELEDSRVKTTETLWHFSQHSPTLQHYISASGITCYGFEDNDKIYSETDSFGSDYLSLLTQKWESAADLFLSTCLVTKLRLSVVFSDKGGALVAFSKPIKKGFGAVLGSGKQVVPWIQLDDLTRVIEHIIEKRLAGVYNVNEGNITNKELTLDLAKKLEKRIWLPNVPSFILYFILGKRAQVVVKGSKANNEKLLATGFRFMQVLVLFLCLSSCGIFSPSASKTTFKNLQSAPYDAIIVPGVPHDGRHWSETMMNRVKWSKYLYDKGYAKNIIYSGSAVYTEYIEAETMAIYAQAMGIPSEHIFVEPRAEHSTENVYYSYRVAKKNGFEKIALATDPFQTNTLRKFIQKFELPVGLLPIIYDTLNMQDLSEPTVDIHATKKENFVSIVERESFRKRFKGTMGQNIRWQKEDLKTKHLRKKYGNRIEGTP